MGEVGAGAGRQRTLIPNRGLLALPEPVTGDLFFHVWVAAGEQPAPQQGLLLDASGPRLCEKSAN